jgi:hypothetical protein
MCIHTFDKAFNSVFENTPSQEKSHDRSIGVAQQEAQRDYHLLNKNNNPYCLLTESLMFSVYEREFNLIQEGI